MNILPETSIERVETLKNGDLHDLCDAADDAIQAGGGFGWVEPPDRAIMERYWKGVLVVPERTLFVARLDGVIAGSAQLVRPPRNNEAQSHAASLTTSFVAPWARGHKMARRLTVAVEEEARALGFKILNLDVRATQEVAITLYESLGYVRWGTHPLYAMVQGAPIIGHYYFKDLSRDPGQDERAS